VKSTADQLKALLGDTEFRALQALAGSSAPVSGRALARALNVSPTTATSTLQVLSKAGFVVSSAEGRSRLWSIEVSNPMMHNWLHESNASPVHDDREHRVRPRMTTVIFTALQLEYEAVAAHLPDRRRGRVGTTRFEVADFAGEYVDWTVHIAELGMGNTRTAIEAATAISELDPDLMLFVGVAGSVKPDDLVLGDIVVAERVYDLHAGKDAWDEAEGSVHLTRALSFTAADGVVNLAKAVRRDNWAAEMPAGQALNSLGVVPRVEIKPIAAGSVVHADRRSALMEKVRRVFNDVAAVDMESLGLYEAADKTLRPALTIRGISDCVQDKTPDADREWQPKAAHHAAAFAFAVLRRAEPEDLPRPGTVKTATGDAPPAIDLSPIQLLLRLAPRVALAYEWAEPQTGPGATALLKDLAALGDQPATWLSRFKHRPPQDFRSPSSGPLWVMVAEFAAGHEHPAAPWFFEQAAQNCYDDAVLAAYLYCQAAMAAARDRDTDTAERMLTAAETAAPAGHRLWALYQAGLGSDNAELAQALLAVEEPLELPLPSPVLAGLGAESAPAGPDKAFAGFVEEFADCHPAFFESMRLTVTLATAAVLRETPGQIDAAQILLDHVNARFPAFRSSPASASAIAALTGPRASRTELELAKTLCVAAVDSASAISGLDRDAALTRAEELALLARGRLQDWGGPTAGALVLAAQARTLRGDIHGALAMLMPPPTGTAEPSEATSVLVIPTAAGLAAQTGKTDLALDLASKIDDPVDRRLVTALALTSREDTHREAAIEFRAALTEISSDSRGNEELQALLGLSMVATLEEDELSRLQALDPEGADMVRAKTLLSVGKIAQAQILARRYPHSDAALQIRVEALMHQGKTNDAVAALERFSTQHGHDERHLLQAAVLALHSGSTIDAERLARSVTSSTDPSRARTAREILIEAASRREDWHTVLEQTRRLTDAPEIAEADPNRKESLTKYRWAKVHALHQLRRMDDAYDVIRTEPRLEPADHSHARLVASVLRSIAPSVTQAGPDHSGAGITQAEILAAAIDVAQAFPDDEELVATAVMTAFTIPLSQDTNYRLLSKARQLQQQFFENFPHSNLIEQVPIQEPDPVDGLREFLRARLAPVADPAHQMQQAAVNGQIPISACAAALGRNYADMLIRNSASAYVIRYPDDSINAQETAAARDALNTAVVADTSALFLATHVLPATMQLPTYFEQLLVAAPQRDDILQAKTSLSMRNSGWLGWDPRTQQPVFTEYSQDVIQSWSDQAQALAALVESCDIRPDAPADNDDARNRVWSAPIRLARELGIGLLADDAALRAAARSQGVPAFGSLHMLEVLIEDGTLPADALEQSYGRLMKLPIAELPVADRLIEIARNEQWDSHGYAAFLLSRPSTWQPLTDGWRNYTTLIRALPDKDPEATAKWCLAALRGLCLVATPPSVPAVAGMIVAWTMFELGDGSVLPLLLDEVQEQVRGFAPEADLLQEVVQRLVMAVRRITPPEAVGTIVVRLLAGLEGETHVKALKIFFTMP
jgi:nucleoside phosphorylase